MRKLSVLACLLLPAVLFAAGASIAQTFPSKTVRLVSGVTPGSASDTMARVVAEKLQASLGQSVIVENRLGAGGLIGAQYVARAEPDGHLVMVYTSAFTVAPLLNPGALDPKELVPVATLATVPTALVVSAAKPYKSLADLVAAAKARPGQLIAVSAGIGSSTHMNLERFRIAAGIEVLHVPLKGTSEAMTEIIAGRADLYFAPVFTVTSHLKEGKILALAMGSPGRSTLLPDVPTTVEAGYPNSDYNFWVGALIAAKTPRDIVLRLNKEINAAVNSADVRERILKLGADPLTMSLPEYEAMIASEFDSNAKLIKAANIRSN